ncbi:hypothetical protein PG984_010031 [Apiospora sp. TS-2023a]
MRKTKGGTVPPEGNTGDTSSEGNSTYPNAQMPMPATQGYGRSTDATSYTGGDVNWTNPYAHMPMRATQGYGGSTAATSYTSADATSYTGGDVNWTNPYAHMPMRATQGYGGSAAATGYTYTGGNESRAEAPQELVYSLPGRTGGEGGNAGGEHPDDDEEAEDGGQGPAAETTSPEVIAAYQADPEVQAYLAKFRPSNEGKHAGRMRRACDSCFTNDKDCEAPNKRGSHCD